VLAAGVVDEDAAHGFGRRGEEVNASVPGLLRVGTDQLEIRLVDEGRGLEGVPGPLAGEASCGQPPQLVVDQR
jgi:hypothetical protein